MFSRSVVVLYVIVDVSSSFITLNFSGTINGFVYCIASNGNALPSVVPYISVMGSFYMVPWFILYLMLPTWEFQQ